MKKSQAFTLVELMVVVGIIGILASLAIPNFMGFLSKAKQAEAKANLGAIYQCQIGYFSIANTYAGKSGLDGKNAFVLIDFTPIAGNNRYAYILDEAVIMPKNYPIGPTALPSGVQSTGHGFTVMAVGNIDADAYLDAWYVNDAQIFENRDPSGTCSSCGNDVGSQ